MPTTRTRANVDELRNRLRQARAMPALLQLQRDIRQGMTDVSDELEDGAGDDQATLQALWTQLDALFKELGDRLIRTAERDEFERRQAGIPIGGSTDQQWNRRLLEYRIGVAIAASLGQQFGGNFDAGPERETSAELARRTERAPQGFFVPRAALSLRMSECPPHLLRSIERRDVISSTTPPGGPGGNIIPTVWDAQQWIDPLRAQTKVRALGARVISDLTANLNLPKMSKPATTAFFAENSPIVRSDEEFVDVQLRPKHAGAILEASRNMIMQALNPGIEALIRLDLTAVLAQAVDQAAISGAGGIEPLGIVSDPLTPTLPAAAPSYDQLVDLTSLLATANALQGSLGWLADATVRGALLKLKDTLTRPFGLDLLFQGYRYEFTNLAAVAAGTLHPIIFGNWDDLVIGEWSAVDLLTNPYDSDAYSKGNILVRAAMTIDVVRRHVESFAYTSPTITFSAAEASAASGGSPQASPEAPRRAR